jgi:hypothetical protein
MHRSDSVRGSSDKFNVLSFQEATL